VKLVQQNVFNVAIIMNVLSVKIKQFGKMEHVEVVYKTVKNVISYLLAMLV